jgi:hypothetical protein
VTIRTPDDFLAEARTALGSSLDTDIILRRLLLIANEYQAAGIEAHARTPQRESDRAVRAARGQLAEEIARSIETLSLVSEGCGDPFCADCIRAAQARDDAATARRIGHAVPAEAAA